MRAAALSLGVVAGLVGLVLLYTPQQAQRGQKLFTESCAVCHGPAGDGGRVPQRFGALAGRRVPSVVGPNALANFQTASDLFRYAQQRMPLDDPGSLTDEQYLAVTAWLLERDGVEANGEPLTPESAAQVPIR